MPPQQSLRAAASVAALLFVLQGTYAAVVCPAAASTGAIQCYQGFSATSPPTTGVSCTCMCGLSSSSASSMTFYATSSGGCTTTVCATNFPSDCASASYKSASSVAIATALADYGGPPAPTGLPGYSDSICMAYSATCTSDPVSNPCGIVTSGSISMYAMWAYNPTDGTAVAQCNAFQQDLLATGGLATITTICTTNLCNQPLPNSASLHVAPAAAILGAAVAAAWL
jgi:hypothetical protein